MTRHRIDTPPPSATAEREIEPVPFDEGLEARLAQFREPPGWAPRPRRRHFRERFAAGLRGFKHALRGDSSYFAHAYRGLIIALTAALLRVGPLQWCMLVMAAGLVLLAELAHSAVDVLARSLGDGEAPGPTAAREIATAGVLAAVVIYAGVSITVLTLRFVELFGG